MALRSPTIKAPRQLFGADAARAATLMLAMLMLAWLLAGALHYFDVLMP